MKKFPFFITVFALISASVPAAYAWTNPTANPASGAGAVFVEAGAPANAIYIKSNGNVGVGTTTPARKLHIYDPTAGGGFRLEGISDGPNIEWSTGAIRHWNIDQYGTDPYLRFFTEDSADGTGAVRILITETGNVGIGMTPVEKLDVTGNIRASGTITATGGFSGSLTGSISAANVSSGAFGGSQGGGVYGFPDKLSVGYGLGSTPTTLSQTGILAVSGNVGIGTVTPAARLHVDGGDIKLADTATASTYTIKSYNGGSSLWLMGATGQQLVIADAHSWDRSVSVSYSAGTTGAGAGVLTIGQTNKNGATYTHGITNLYTNGLERVRIDSAGDVGINTTDPGYKLEINGDVLNRGKQHQYTQLGQGSGAHGISWYAPSYYTWYDYMAPPGTTNSPSGTPAPTDAASGITSWARRFNIENVSGYGWIFESGTNASGSAPTVKFAINSNNGNFHSVGSGYIDGNFGIGVTSTTYGLDVRRSITASTGAAIGTNLQQTLTASAINDVLTALKVNPTFVPGAYTGVTQYAIDATGTIKATAFEGGLSGTVSARNVSSGSFGGNTSGGVYGFPDKVSVGYGLDSTPTTLSQTGTLAVSGNVGIGTTAPNSKLDIALSAPVASSYIRGGAGSYGVLEVGVPNTVDNKSFISLHRGGTVVHQLGISGSDLVFASGGGVSTDALITERMRLTSSGNLGVGGIVPTSKLEISAGSLRVPASGYEGAGQIQSTGTVRIANAGSAQELYAKQVSATDSWSDADTNKVTNGVYSKGGFLSKSAGGQVFFKGQQVGATYAYGSSGIFQAVTDNLTGSANTYFQGVTGTTTNFSVRADGQGYFAGSVGIGTPTPVAALDMGASGGIRLGGVTRTTWPGGLDTPIYTNLIYGSAGDLPWRTTSTTPQTMRYLYYPFLGGMPTCPSGYTKQHRLYGEVVDNISTGGQLLYVRMAFDGGLTRDFSLGSTWGGSPSYKTYLSALFTETNTNHANIQAWVNGVAGPYIEIRRLELRTYCI